MSKYDALGEHLAHQSTIADLTFGEIETIIGASLPASARQYEEWWANDDPTHTQSAAWGRVGYTASPDLTNRKVRFVRRGIRPPRDER